MNLLTHIMANCKIININLCGEKSFRRDFQQYLGLVRYKFEMNDSCEFHELAIIIAELQTFKIKIHK